MRSEPEQRAGTVLLMLETVDLTRRVSREEYRPQRRQLQNRMYQLHRACWEHDIGVVIIVEGWEGCGKGEAIRTLTRRMEPRGFTVHSVQAPRTHELSMPWLWRFWLMLPNHGEMAIYDHSWYRQVLLGRLERVVTERETERAYQDVKNFERLLADDEYVIIKLFFHISKKKQKKRLRKLQEDELSSWRVQPDAWDRHRRYDDFLASVEEAIARTETEWAPWTIIPANSRRWARLDMLSSTVARLEAALVERGHELPATIGEG